MAEPDFYWRVVYEDGTFIHENQPSDRCANLEFPGHTELPHSWACVPKIDIAELSWHPSDGHPPQCFVKLPSGSFPILFRRRVMADALNDGKVTGTIHVIGFQRGPDGSKVLVAIAQNGGDVLVTTRDADLDALS